MSVDWNMVVGNLTAPGGVVGVLIAGGAFWKKFRRVDPSTEEAKTAIEMETGPKETRKADTASHMLIDIVADLQREVRSLKRRFGYESRVNRVQGNWIEDVRTNWPIHRIREEPPAPPVIEPFNEEYE